MHVLLYIVIIKHNNNESIFFQEEEYPTYPPPPPTHHRRPPHHSSGCCTSWTPPDSLSHSRQGRTGQRCPLALSCKQTSPSSANTNSVTFNKDKLHTVLLPNMTVWRLCNSCMSTDLCKEIELNSINWYTCNSHELVFWWFLSFL